MYYNYFQFYLVLNQLYHQLLLNKYFYQIQFIQDIYHKYSFLK
jgi:hypothetical protein